MEKFYVVISQVSDGGLQMDGQDYANEAEARGTAKQDCQRSGERHFVAEVIAAFERPEPQIVEHNLSGRRKRKVAPAPEKKPAEKKRKVKEAAKEEAPVEMISARPDSIPDPNLPYCRDCRPEGYEWGKSSVGTCSICHEPLRQVRRVK